MALRCAVLCDRYMKVPGAWCLVKARFGTDTSHFALTCTLVSLPCAVVWCVHRYMRVPGVSARFGTDPFIWNWAMWLVARLCPRQFLQDRSQVRRLRISVLGQPH